jgi:hypothetical protein
MSTTIKNTAKVFNIVYEPTVGIDETFLYYSDEVFTDPIPVGAIYDLAGYTAEGALLDECGGTELLALSGSEASPGVDDAITFVIQDDKATNPDTGDVVTVTNAQGIRFRLEPFPDVAETGWYYINLITPGGDKLPFIKGTYSPDVCGC